MKKLQHDMSGDISATSTDERKTWFYAFAILVLVSIWMVGMRLSGNAFLAPDFEATVIYLPTVVAGIVAGYIALRRPRHQ